MSDESEENPTQTVIKYYECGASFNLDGFCKNCHGSLCEACKERHKTRTTRSKHSVVLRTKTFVRTHGHAKKTEQCARHQEKNIAIYCITCKVARCDKSLSESHMYHDSCPIEEAYLEKEQGLNVYIKEPENDVQKNLDAIIDCRKHDSEESESSVSKAIENVNQFRKETEKEVDAQCDCGIDTLQQSNIDNTNSIYEIQKQKQNVATLVRECKEKIWEGKLDLVEYDPSTSSSLLPNQPNVPSVKAEFVPNMKPLDGITKGLGKIEFSDVEQKRNAASRNDGDEFDKSKLKIKKIGNFESSNILISSIVMAGKCKAWTSNPGYDTMYLYDDRGAIIRSVTVEKGVGIMGAAITLTGRVIVTNYDKKVRCVSENDTVTTLIDTAPFMPFGVCLTETEEIVVCMRDQCRKNHVAIYTPDGKSKVSEITGSDANKSYAISDPFRVVQNDNDFCVIDCGKNVVYLSQKGVLRWVYDGTQARLPDTFNPLGICCDKYRNLLMCDNNNHCIHYVDRNGQFIQSILTNEQIGLLDPWTIGVDDETGQAWIGNDTIEVVIAKYIN